MIWRCDYEKNETIASAAAGNSGAVGTLLVAESGACGTGDSVDYGSPHKSHNSNECTNHGTHHKSHNSNECTNHGTYHKTNHSTNDIPDHRAH